MRILYVVHSYPPFSFAGSEIYAQALANALVTRHEVAVFYRVCDGAYPQYAVTRNKNGPVDTISINNTFKAYRNFKDTYANQAIADKFAQILDAVKPDIVHIQLLLYLSVLIIEEIRKRNIPMVMTLNDYWLLCPQGQFYKNASLVCDNTGPEGCSDCVMYQLAIRQNFSLFYSAFKKVLPGWLLSMIEKSYIRINSAVLNAGAAKMLLEQRRVLMRDMCSKVDTFLAPSGFMRDIFILSGISADKIRMVGYGFSDCGLKTLSRRSSACIRFAFIGNMMPAKGLHVLIKSFYGIAPGKAQLVIYGTAYSYKSELSGYTQRIRSMAPRDNIKLMGAFHHERIKEVFENIDVLIVPSLWQENSPLVIQEAFMAKTPVIASRIGGIPELVIDGVNGFLFEPGNIAQLRGLIDRVIENPSILDELSKNIPAVKSIEENARELEEIYKQLIAAGPSGATTESLPQAGKK